MIPATRAAVRSATTLFTSCSLRCRIKAVPRFSPLLRSDIGRQSPARPWPQITELTTQAIVNQVATKNHLQFHRSSRVSGRGVLRAPSTHRRRHPGDRGASLGLESAWCRAGDALADRPEAAALARQGGPPPDVASDGA